MTTPRIPAGIPTMPANVKGRSGFGASSNV